MSGELIAGIITAFLTMLGSGVAGWWSLRRVNSEHRNKINQLAADMEQKQKDDHLENQKLIRDRLAAQSAENDRKDRTIEQLTQDNSRHAELRAVSETQVEMLGKQNIILERQLGNTISKAIDEAKSAERERVKAEMLEKQVQELTQEREELRGRVGELEEEVKVIPLMKDEIAKLQEQVAQLMEERARKDKEIDQLKAAVNDAA